MWVARLADGEQVTLPDAPFVHLFVASGAVNLGDEDVATGDAVRLATAASVAVVADGASEIIVWESAASVAR